MVIVGAGATGIEIAGEIKTDYPNTLVTLIHAKPRVFDQAGFKSEFVDKL